LSRRQALTGFGIALAGGLSGSVASARAAVAPARDTRAGLAAGLTNAQLAGQRVIASYPGLTPPTALFTDISNGQVAGVIFFGENISSQAQIAGVVTQLRQAQAQGPVQVPLLLMTDQEGGLVRRLPGQPTLSEKQIGQSSNPVAAATAAGTGAGQNLAGVGMNVNLAPVLDVYYKAGNFIDQYRAPTVIIPPWSPLAARRSSPPSSRSAWRLPPSTSPAWDRPPRTRTPTTGR
jgi:beta-N-acetylhexosaminidase